MDKIEEAVVSSNTESSGIWLLFDSFVDNIIGYFLLFVPLYLVYSIYFRICIENKPSKMIFTI